MRAWLVHHALSLAHTLSRLGRAPMPTLFNVLVIGVVIALPLGGYCLLASLQGLSGQVSADPQITLFLAGDAGKADIAAIETRLRRTPGIKAMRFVGRDVALAGLKRDPSLAEVISTLRDNPLPDAFVVWASSDTAEASARLEREFRTWPKVAQVQAEAVWIARLDALLQIGRAAVGLLAGLLAFSLVAVTFNTIRLQIVTHRDEIEVSRLVGATDAYIRRPFFYLGSVQAGLGGVAALAIVYGALVFLNAKVAPLARSYGATFQLAYPEASEAVAVLFGAALLGWLGAYLSVSVHLRKTQASD